MKILVVDDQKQERSILRYYLEDKGWEVLEADDGKEGLAIACRERPDVIVSDILMKEMDGYEFLREVRLNDALGKVPFIFYTGIYSTAREAKLARDLGVNAFIVKPEEAERFCQHLEIVLQRIGDEDVKPNKDLLHQEDRFLREYNDVVTNQLKRQVQFLEKTRADLEKQKFDYRDLFNSIRDVIVIGDLDRRIIDANQPALRDVFGYELEEIVGQSARILYPDEESFRKMGKIFFDNVETEVWSVVVSEFRRKNGELFKCEFYPLKMTDSDGNVVANVSMVRDISRRQKIEDTLQSVFESMGEGLAIVDRELSISVANKAYGEMFGADVESVVGKKCYEITRGYDEPCYAKDEECPALQAFETGEEQSVDHLQRDGSGKVLHYSNRVYPIKDEDGRVNSVIEVYRDITEQTLLEEQLRQAQKMEAIGTLTGGIAHDFNNILSVIVGHGTLMQLKVESEHPLRRSIDNIMEATERATSLTQRLLTFSRKQFMELKPVLLDDVVGNLENLLQKMIREDIKLNISLSEEPLVIEADDGQLEQLIMNLVINASQAISGYGHIEVGAGKGVIDENFIREKGFGETGSCAVLTIRDDGSGMDRETLEKIYEPFFTTKDVGQGTGLGLSVAYGIVKQHKGFIDCVSTPGAGTTFRIYFPLSEEASCQFLEEQPRHAELSGGNATIMVVEDDENVRLLLRELIEEAGYEVVTADNGIDAIRKFTETTHQIDLLILDVIMPQLNGRETLAEIRKHDPEVRAIFISGYTDDILQDQGMSDKSVPMLQKPLSPNVLLEEIRKSMGQ